VLLQPIANSPMVNPKVGFKRALIIGKCKAFWPRGTVKYGE